jgi:hypothetical protein
MENNEQPLIYHYTGIEGLQGILQSQSLWATDFHFSNDYTELLMFKELMGNELLSRADATTKKIVSIVLNGIYGLLEKMDDPIALQIYISSFSKEGDLLSQWRGYGEYSIGFDYKELDALGTKEFHQDNGGAFFFFEDVVYGVKEKIPPELEKDVAEILTILRQYSSYEEEERLHQCIEKFFRCMCRFKHEGFQEENEYRLVSFCRVSELNKPYAKEIQYRNVSGTLVPYIALFAQNDQTVRLPIKEIIIGPSRDADLRIRSVEALLKQLGIDAEVKKSGIPYRGF